MIRQHMEARRRAECQLVAAARELRDRWLEPVNAGEYLPEARGTYDVGRALDTMRSEKRLIGSTTRLLEAA